MYCIHLLNLVGSKAKMYRLIARSTMYEYASPVLHVKPYK